MPSDVFNVDVNIGSRFENIDLVDVLSEAMLRFSGLGEDSIERLALAIREAVANGVQHGNKEDPAKRVSISFVLKSDEIEIRVTDEGEGFDLSTLPDPLDPQNLFKPRGRGILLMNSFVDHVSYDFDSNGGTTVTLKKGLAPLEKHDKEGSEA